MATTSSRHAKKPALIVRSAQADAQFAYELATDLGLQAFMDDLRTYPLLTREDEQQLGHDLASADVAVVRQARTRLTVCNLRLVVAIAKRFCGQGMPAFDLINEGVLGLLEAISHYQPRPSARFCSYAGWWITQAIQRALIDTGQAVRLPAYLVELRKKIWRVSQRFEDEHGRAPSESELRLLTGASAYALHEALLGAPTVVSLDRPITSVSTAHEEPLTLGERMADTSLPTMETLVCTDETYRDLYTALRTHLTEREVLVLAYRYGLGGLGRETPADYASRAERDRRADDAPHNKLEAGERCATQSEATKQKGISNRAVKEEVKEAVNNPTFSSDGLMQHVAIAQRMGLSPEWVRTIEMEAMKKLRAAYGAAFGVRELRLFLVA